MKDLMLGVHVVVKNLKLEISACRFEDYVKNATEQHWAHANQRNFGWKNVILSSF